MTLKTVLLGFLISAGALAAATPPVPPTALSLFLAENRRAAGPGDLALLRSATHSRDARDVQIAVRSLGRLERPSLIPDILPLLRHPLPEVRAEAANAIGQSAEGDKTGSGAINSQGLSAATTSLIGRLQADSDPDVRAAICETLGRLPYRSEDEARRAENALLAAASKSDAVDDRLGVAKGFEALIRLQHARYTPSAEALATIARLATPNAGAPATAARVRRLAIGAIVSASAGHTEDSQDAERSLEPIVSEIAAVASHDTDAQVRMLATHLESAEALESATSDASPMVRIESLRQLHARYPDLACPAALRVSNDADTLVAIVALDDLATCGSTPGAPVLPVLPVVSDRLASVASDISSRASPREWQRMAHAFVSLAAVDPDRAKPVVEQASRSRLWQVRMYSARAAALLSDRALLETLAGNDDDNVREAAVDGLSKVAGHAADAVYVSGLSRSGYQIVRASALALVGTSNIEMAGPALRAAAARLIEEGRDNSHDARGAIDTALLSIGDHPSIRHPAIAEKRAGTRGSLSTTDLTADGLHRLASPRARVTVRDVGTFELALFTGEAPASVLRFARLAESGYYNGLTFHRVVPDFVIQGGSPGANEYIGDATFMRDEVGLWPHVRGAVGISTRGRDTGDAQIFIDLVDNPRLDHEYTVFGQVLNGMDVVDHVIEGDVIDRIEILP